VGQVVRVDPDTVPSNQARREGEKVPLGPGCGQDVRGPDVHAGEDQGEFIHEGDVDVPLGVLDDLGRLGHPDGRRQVGAGGDDGAVEFVDGPCRLRGGSRGDLPDAGHPVRLVSRVDALRAVAAEKVRVVFQARHPFDDRYAVLLGAARIDRGLEDHDGSDPDDLSHGLAGRQEQAEVRPVVPIDGGGHGHDIDGARPQVLDAGGALQQGGCPELLAAYLEGPVGEGLQLGYSLFVDVETHGMVFLAELHGQREPDIPKPDDCYTVIHSSSARTRWLPPPIAHCDRCVPPESRSSLQRRKGSDIERIICYTRPWMECI